MNPTHFNHFTRVQHVSSGRAATPEQILAAAQKSERGWPFPLGLNPPLAYSGPVALCGQVLYPFAYHPVESYRGKRNKVCKKCAAAVQKSANLNPAKENN